MSACLFILSALMHWCMMAGIAVPAHVHECHIRLVCADIDPKSFFKIIFQVSAAVPSFFRHSLEPWPSEVCHHRPYRENLGVIRAVIIFACILFAIKKILHSKLLFLTTLRFQLCVSNSVQTPGKRLCGCKQVFPRTANCASPMQLL